MADLLAPLVDVTALPCGIASLVEAWASDEPTATFPPCATAIVLHGATRSDGDDLERCGAARGAPLPLVLAPTVLTRHLRRVARTTQSGEPGRN